jgi:energy-coupling factor transport system substrate-specific component
MCIINSLLSFITGTLWTIALGLLTGGLAAELIGRLGKTHNVIVSVASYAAFGLFLHFGIIGIVFFANDYWRQYVSKIGVNETYIDTISKTISWPLLVLSCAAVVLCAALGIMLGRFILKKHFVKAGLVEKNG